MQNNIANPKATKTNAYLVTLNAMIWAVMVVPMFAPMITPVAWDNVTKPDEMKLIRRTVVMDDD